MYTKESVKTYKFYCIEFTVRNYRGVFFLSDKTKEQIKQLTPEQAKKVNQEAWKQLRMNKSVANRSCNWSVPGNINTYEEAHSHYDAAQQVAKESYKTMMGYH